MVTKYIPVYGVEPYNAQGVPLADDYGGGADITQQNLLTTLWLLETPQVVADGGVRIKPSVLSNNPGVAVIGPGLLRQQFNSRYAARFLLASIDNYIEVPNYLAILQMPPEVLEGFLINNAAEATLPQPTLNLKNPFVSQYCWDAKVEDVINRHLAVEADITFSDVANASLPLLAKSDGSDGNYPAFWDMTQAATYNALRAGAPAYACCLMQFDSPATPANALVTIRWPHSSARG
jgi:hypothetical protein